MLDLHSTHGFNSTQLADYVLKQLDFFFPDGYNSKEVVGKNIGEALDRMNFSLKFVKLSGYNEFNHLHSDLYAQFIYFLSNSVWINDSEQNASTKLFYLNKVLHGFNCVYDTKLPDIFLLIHTIGTVLGKATYSDYFVACQNVTVGSDKGNSPVLKKGVYMGPGSAIIGKSNVGEYSHLSVHSVVLDQDIPGNCSVFGNSLPVVTRTLKRNLVKEQYFKIE